MRGVLSFLLASGVAALTCNDIAIPVSVSALNKNFPPDLSIDSLLTPGLLNKIVAGLTSSLVSGDYTIGARYCEPSKDIASRRDTLQVLVHGITYTKDYWSGLAPPGTLNGQDEHSWVKYAADQGYATLSVDRLCNGASSKPNGLAFCQAPLQAEAMRAVIEQAKAGSLPGVAKTYGKIVYVGHSYGSLVANSLAAQHPDLVDAYVLTGFSGKLLQDTTGILILPGFTPAAVVDPKNYGAGQVDALYLMATNPTGTQKVFYYGDYDLEVLNYDYNHRQTVTLGEILTVILGQGETAFGGDVFVLNGNEDAVFCQANLLSALAGAPGNCANGFSSAASALYPKAKSFGFYNTPNTGHCLGTHQSAQQSFAAAHDHLQSLGY